MAGACIFAAVMKKIVAILLLALMGFTIIADGMAFHAQKFEQVADTKESDKDCKDAKKEIKEFTAYLPKKLLLVNAATNAFMAHYSLLLPKPALATHTPPPNSAC